MQLSLTMPRLTGTRLLMNHIPGKCLTATSTQLLCTLVMVLIGTLALVLTRDIVSIRMRLARGDNL